MVIEDIWPMDWQHESAMKATKALAIKAAVPVLVLVTVSRRGKNEADYNNGVYTMDALSYLAEVELADIITTTYLNTTHRRASQVQIGNLKNRDTQPFDSFVTSSGWVGFSCRQIITTK